MSGYCLPVKIGTLKRYVVPVMPIPDYRLPVEIGTLKRYVVQGVYP